MCARTYFDSRPCRARPTFLFEVSLVQGPRGHLGLSGAENPESNEQGAGRQRAPRAAEFVSKNLQKNRSRISAWVITRLKYLTCRRGISQKFGRGYVEQAFRRQCVSSELLHGEENVPFIQCKDHLLLGSGRQSNAHELTRVHMVLSARASG
jgi:hypothetical protein